jgi:putative transposase
VYKGFKVKIYPNKEQQEKLFQFFGASRFSYNWTIAKEEESYKQGDGFLNKTQLAKLWKEEKKQYPWIKEISGRALRGGIYNALDAYKRYFQHLANKPKFKKKKYSGLSCRTHEENTLIERNRIKFEKLGWIRCHNYLPATWSIHDNGRSMTDTTLCNPIISYDGVDFWFSVSIDVDFIAEKNLNQTDAIGIDLGIKKLATDSSKIDCIKPNIKKDKKKLKRLQRRASRYYDRRLKESKTMKTKLSKIPKSKNLLKLERKINKVYRRIDNKLTTNIHEYTTKLVKMNPKAICIEDLNVDGMRKNKHLSEKINEAKFYEFRRQLTYKCEEYDIPLIVADKWFASSKICHCCGNKKKILSLSERTYVCEKCGYVEDRDYNASLNLRDLAYN